VEKCKQRYGTLVINYWQNNSWVNLKDLDLNFNQIQLSLNVVSIYPSVEDVLIWHAEPSGQFKVSSTFVSKEKVTPPLWSQAWVKGLIPKVNIFLWILLQNKILTLDNMQKRGINLVNRCVLCKNGLEDRDHLFLNCAFSQQVWSEILMYWNLSWVHQNNVDLAFNSWKCPSRNLDVQFLWKISLPHLWWGIWKERNNRIFRNKEIPGWVLGQNIIRAFKENFRSQRTTDLAFPIDTPLLTDNPKLLIDNPRLTTKWNLPPFGWIKGNFDGAAKGNPGNAGCGGVLRDHMGNVIDAIAIPIGHSNSHIAEATAALYTMRIAVELGCPNLWLEGDSLNIVNILNNKCSTSWSIEVTIKEMKNLIQNFEKIVFTHTYREANLVADWIANYAILKGQRARWIDDLSNHFDLKAIIHYESTHAEVGNIWKD
jgi:ribonuclease HI